MLTRTLYQRGLWRPDFAIACALVSSLWVEYCDFKTVGDIDGMLKVGRLLRSVTNDMGMTLQSLSRLSAEQTASQAASEEVPEDWLDADGRSLLA
jgi:hypothetical protein